MKRVTVFILFLTSIGFIQAQRWTAPGNRNTFTPYNDIRIGIGYKPFEAAYAFGNFSLFEMDPWVENPNLIDLDTKDYYSGARYTTNALFCEYIYQANKWFGLGGTFTYFSYFNSYFDAMTDASVGFNSVHHFSIYPTVRLTWLNLRGFSMYSSFGIGQRLVLQSDELRYNRTSSGRIGIAGQFTLLGLTIGKNTYCFSDLSTLGTQGIITVGIGYRVVSFKHKNHERQTDIIR